MSRRSAGRLAWGSGALALALWVIGEVLYLLSAGLDVLVGLGFAILVVCATVGALVVSRQPRNPIGWVLCAVAVATGLDALARGYAEHWLSGRQASQTLGQTAAWFSEAAWVFFILVPAVFLPLLFPDGRLLSRRWRPVAWCGALGIAGIVAAELLTAGPLDNFPQLENPYAVESPAVDLLEPLGSALPPLAALGAALSLVLRFRRSGYEQRQQIKWIAWAGALMAAAMMAYMPVDALFGDGVANAMVALGVLGLPLAAGLAILRYRLYEIDVVINRTLVYGALTATLAGSYLGSVLLLQLVLSAVTAGSGLAVAGSTLAVAALFQPARRRIQAIVDRRFYRRKYDAARTLERFGAHLRDEVSLDALSDDLRRVVADTMAPAHVTLWLRAPEARR